MIDRATADDALELLVGELGRRRRLATTRTTFDHVPDVPVTKFVLTLPGGKHGLLIASTNLCRTPPRAIVQLTTDTQPSGELTRDLLTFLTTRLAVMKLPRRIEYRDRVPRDANGKLLRRALREEASL